MQGRVFLNRYETIRLLGEGGMGRVYLARQTDLGRQVVVKVMHDHIAADPAFRMRFQRETLLTARFQHPYAVSVFDATLDDPEGPCIVMEYIRGETLDAILTRNKRIEITRVGRLLHQICEVLQAAHNEGIIHRDLKPANLMVVDPETQYEIIKVMDFGLAKMLGPESLSGTTNHDFAVGTPGYMCPEQARGEEVDHRGDLYSLGVILFELLTGRLPFAGRGTMEVLLAHATEEPPTFSTVGAFCVVPPAIERVVMACMAKNPGHRPRHARELSEMYQDALASAQGQQSGGIPSLPPPRTPRLRPARSGQGHPSSYSPVSPSAHAPAAHVPSAQGMYSSLTPLPVPEPVVVKAPTPPSALHVNDPSAIVQHLEAWMPETIAAYKLRGFIHESGGELVESVPGRINVRLGGKGCVYSAPTGGLSWLGLGRRPTIDVTLHLHRADAARDNQLKITVVFRSPGRNISGDAGWRSVCGQVFIDLRAFLMGQNQPVGQPGA
jgi:eukaryotic-like serine/threonine-protein kinase